MSDITLPSNFHKILKCGLNHKTTAIQRDISQIAGRAEVAIESSVH